MARKVLDGTIYVNVALGYSSAAFGVGDTVRCDTGLYVFGSANGAIAEGDICKYVEGTFDFDPCTTSESGSANTQLGVCVTAGGLADNYFGWFWRGQGSEEVLLATTIAADAQVTTTATAGTGGAGGDNIDGLFANESSGSGGLTNCRAAGLLQTNMTIAAS